MHNREYQKKLPKRVRWSCQTAMMMNLRWKQSLIRLSLGLKIEEMDRILRFKASYPVLVTDPIFWQRLS